MMKRTAAIRRMAVTLIASLAASTALACIDNPFYPMVEGASWTYRADSMNFTQTILESTDTTVVMRMELDGQEPMDMTYVCDENGILLSSMMDGLMEGMEFEVISMEGTSYPHSIAVGDEWSDEIVMATSMTMEGMTMNATSTVATRNRAVAMESVTVPAGTFNALRLEAFSDITNVTMMMGMEIPVSMTSTSDTWLAEGVGMVLSVDEMGGRVELVSYSIP